MSRESAHSAGIDVPPENSYGEALLQLAKGKFLYLHAIGLWTGTTGEYREILNPNATSKAVEVYGRIPRPEPLTPEENTRAVQAYGALTAFLKKQDPKFILKDANYVAYDFLSSGVDADSIVIFNPITGQKELYKKAPPSAPADDVAAFIARFSGKFAKPF